MTTMIDVGLADDDPLVRRTLTDILNTTEDIRVAWAVRDGQEVLDRLGSGDAAVEVLLLDIQMPRIDGIALAEILHRERPELGVLILTTFVADAVLERALAAGVRGRSVACAWARGWNASPRREAGLDARTPAPEAARTRAGGGRWPIRMAPWSRGAGARMSRSCCGSPGCTTSRA